MTKCHLSTGYVIAARSTCAYHEATRFRSACFILGLNQRRSPPLHSVHQRKGRTLLQTALHELAYGRAYQNSEDRTASLATWTNQCNWHRPHATLKKINHQPTRPRGQ
jgi:hypothetical protein